MSRAETPTGVVVARVAFAVYLLSAAALVLSPSRDLALVVLRSLQRAVLDMGLGWEAASRVEFVANVVLIIPVPLLGAIALNRYSFLLWVVGGGLLASAGVELVQLVFLSSRTASMADVAANSAGALIGWSVATFSDHRRAGSRPLSHTGPSQQDHTHERGEEV